MLTGPSTEGSHLRIQLLVHETAEEGASRGTISVADQDDVSMIAGSANATLSRSGILLWLESRCIGDVNDKIPFTSIMETLGGRIRDSVDAERRRRINVVVVDRLEGVVEECPYG